MLCLFQGSKAEEPTAVITGLHPEKALPGGKCLNVEYLKSLCTTFLLTFFPVTLLNALGKAVFQSPFLFASLHRSVS